MLRSWGQRTRRQKVAPCAEPQQALGEPKGKTGLRIAATVGRLSDRPDENMILQQPVDLAERAKRRRKLICGRHITLPPDQQ